MEFLTNNLGVIVTAVGGLLMAGIGLFFGWVVKKSGDDEVLKEALDAVEVAVDDTYREFVRGAKKAGEDGKLSEEERSHALGVAKEQAILLAKGPAGKLLLKWGATKIYSLIERFIQKKKAKAKEGKQ